MPSAPACSSCSVLPRSAYLATQTTFGGQHPLGSDSYTVEAHFANIGQLKERAPVKIAGVRIGQVQSITLDPGKESPM